MRASKGDKTIPVSKYSFSSSAWLFLCAFCMTDSLKQWYFSAFRKKACRTFGNYTVLEYPNWKSAWLQTQSCLPFTAFAKFQIAWSGGLKICQKPLKYKSRQFYITFVLKRLRKLKDLCENPRLLCPSKRGELEIQCILPKRKDSVFYWMELITPNCIRKIMEASLIWEILWNIFVVCMACNKQITKHDNRKDFMTILEGKCQKQMHIEPKLELASKYLKIILKTS